MKQFLRRTIAFLVCVCLTGICLSSFAEDEPAAGSPAANTGCIQNQAVVMFRKALTAEEEETILRQSLGNDFILLDSLDFGDGLIVALVASGRYNTGQLIVLLSGNPDIACVQPNYLLQPQSVSYAVSDPLNAYCWHENQPSTENTAGSSVSDRGFSPDSFLSLNTADAWSRMTGEEDEVVVAVMDSGVNVNHEDLKDVLWSNPGNIGLPGEHGFNYADNRSCLNDLEGHGTHCCGIIAAQAGNNAGIAGVASAARVKIMLLATDNADPDAEGLLNSYRELGAFWYILKAKQMGVNIVASSNSWGAAGCSGIYDEIVNRLGEEGILVFFAAGNENINRDYHSYYNGGDSPYRVTVGAADFSGKRAGFSNYGRCSVDLFAPGVNILSTVSYISYFPNIWTREKRSATTAYYGLFDENTVFEGGSVIPSVTDCDETVKPFGASVFRVQSLYDDPDAPDIKPTCEFELVRDHVFTDSPRQASLKVTIHNARLSDEYFLYFPYEKDPATTGSDNTDFSVCVTHETLVGDMPCFLTVGEIVEDSDGFCTVSGDGYEDGDPSEQTNGIIVHGCSAGASDALLLSAEEAEGNTCGIGIQIRAEDNGTLKCGDLHFFLDSIAVSKPDPGLSPDDSYDLMSGTSMATPAAAGAYALLASLYPRQEGQSGSDYVLQNRARLFSCVRMTDELRNLCVTGGYLDLSLLGADNPALTRAVCDPETGNVVLSGINLREDYTLSFRKYAQEGAETVTLPSGSVTVEFAADGTAVTIQGAKDLWGSSVEFLLSDGGSVRAKLCDFLVKGQESFPLVWEERRLKDLPDSAVVPHIRCLLSDEGGKTLFGYDDETGVLLRFDGTQFTELRGTDLNESMLAYLEAQGFSPFDLHMNTTVTPDRMNYPVFTEKTLYHRVKVEYVPSAEAKENEHTEKYFIAAMDFSAAKPQWTFTETKNWPDLFGTEDLESIQLAALGNKLYCIGLAGAENEPFMYSFDAASGSWSSESALPSAASDWTLISGKGKLYALKGLIMIPSKTEGPEKLVRSDLVYMYDGTAWTQLPDIPYAGDDPEEQDISGGILGGAYTVTDDGLLFVNCPAEGGGNCFLYHEDGTIEPLYRTLNGCKADRTEQGSAAVTADGAYFFLEKNIGGQQTAYQLYRIDLPK